MNVVLAGRATSVPFTKARTGLQRTTTDNAMPVLTCAVRCRCRWQSRSIWLRTEASARLDGLYDADGLAAPRISSAELCRWEHGQRRPSEERIEYLCRLYSTRPDRLGFGADYSNVQVGHLSRAGIADIWPRSSPETYTDLVERVRNAREEVFRHGPLL